MTPQRVMEYITLHCMTCTSGPPEPIKNGIKCLTANRSCQAVNHAVQGGRIWNFNCMLCRAQAISVLLKDTERLQQERTAFASKRQVYKGFSNEQMSKESLQRTHSADSMDRQFSFRSPVSTPPATQLHMLCTLRMHSFSTCHTHCRVVDPSSL